MARHASGMTAAQATPTTANAQGSGPAEVDSEATSPAITAKGNNTKKRRSSKARPRLAANPTNGPPRPAGAS